MPSAPPLSEMVIAPAFLSRQIVQRIETMHHRALVGSNDVHAFFQSSFQVVDGWLAGVVVDRRVFQQSICRAGLDEIQVGLWRERVAQGSQRFPALEKGQGAFQVDPITVDCRAVA